MKPKTGFAERLRALRAQASLTQAELAERAGMHLHGLIKLERGEREPQWASVIALANALGVNCLAFSESIEGESIPPRGRGRPAKETTKAEQKPAKRKTKSP